jgi:1-acyl-sn-glycerol-3-phosphate acyltransferase
MPTWFERVFFWMSFCLCNTCLMLASSFRTQGKRFVPLHGPVLVVANHQSMLDPVLVGLSAPRGLTYLARKTLFKNRLVGWVIRTLQAFPVDQEGVAKEGMKAVLKGLAQGRAVVVFPEGSRSEDGAIGPFMRGIALLVERSQAPVVPVGIAGAFAALPRGQRLPRFSPMFLPAQPGAIAVCVGRPIPHQELANLSREQLLDRLRQEITTVQARAERLRRK